MKFVQLLGGSSNPWRFTPAIEAHLDEHRRFLDRHYAAGHFVASGPQVPRTGGVILVKGLCRGALDAVLAEDPFHREQVGSYQVIEFEPNKFGEGAEAVFLGDKRST